MATKTHPHSRRTRRQRNRRIANVVANSWLLVLASHTIATATMMALERLLNLPR